MAAKSRTVVVLYPGCIAYEIQLAAELLNRGFPVLVATPDGRDHVASNGMCIRADAAYAGVAAEDCRAVLVPGGDPERLMDDRTIDVLLSEAMAAGAVIGAICAGPLVLAKAGLLKGRRFTHGYGEKESEFLREYWRDAAYEDRGVVWDGDLVTAKAWAHVAFGVAISGRCGTLPEGRTEEEVRRYYEGRGGG